LSSLIEDGRDAAGAPCDRSDQVATGINLASIRAPYLNGVMEAHEELPAWSLPSDAVDDITISVDWPERVDRDWAWAASTGAGVRVCILDSGIEQGHPLVGEVEGSVAVSLGEEGEPIVEDDHEGDLCGHGTACASIVRSLARDCRIFSVRVLGAGYTGSGRVLLAGLRWAVRQGFDVVNISLSTTKQEFATILHELADNAYFRRTVLVASAHNMPVESFPWRFASVISVGSHESSDPYAFFYNPSPPVEFFARGVDVEIAWLGGTTIRASGNSFATPHMTAISALVLGKHPEITPSQLKSVLQLTATNVALAP
jgi:subtilisin